MLYIHRMNKTLALIGIMATVLVQGAMIPDLIGYWAGLHDNLPPPLFIGLILTGLTLFLVYSIGIKDKILTLSNAAGCVIQAATLATIWSA